MWFTTHAGKEELKNKDINHHREACREAYAETLLRRQQYMQALVLYTIASSLNDPRQVAGAVDANVDVSSKERDSPCQLYRVKKLRKQMYPQYYSPLLVVKNEPHVGWCTPRYLSTFRTKAKKEREKALTRRREADRQGCDECHHRPKTAGEPFTHRVLPLYAATGAGSIDTCIP